MDEYVKFMVRSSKGDEVLQVPWSGLDQTVRYVRDLLKCGKTVQVKPYTLAEWGSRETVE